MKNRGHAVRYPPGVGGIMGKFYNHLLDEGHVDSTLLGKVFDSCPTLEDKVSFLNAVLLQPPTEQQREWIEAFGLAWRWTDILYDTVRSPAVQESKEDPQALVPGENRIH